MARDFAHRFFQQLLSRRNFGPRRSAGRMRQRNEIKALSGAMRAKLATDNLLQLCEFDKLRDRESANRNDETWFQNFDLFVHPGRTVANFVRRRDAISPAGRFAGKAATDGGEVNGGSHGSFVHSAELLEPAEEGLPSRMRERPFKSRLARHGRLPNYHHHADNG